MRLRSNSEYAPMGEINIIPLVDIVLVLLIIFMVTAPLLQHGMNVDLPESESSLQLDDEKTQLVVTVTDDGQILLEDEALSLDELERKIAALLRLENQSYEVVVEGDRRIDYGSIIAAMDAIKAGGIDAVGLVTR